MIALEKLFDLDLDSFYIIQSYEVDLKIIEVVDKEIDQCTFGCPNCNYVFHNHVLMGSEAKEGITLDKLGYGLDLYRQ